MKRRYLLLLWLLVFTGACWRLGGPILDTPEAFRGSAIGAYDRRPVAGVLVVGLWKVSDTLSIHGSTSRGRFVSAALTNESGEFSLPPPRWSLRSPFKLYARDPDMVAIKPGFMWLTTFENQVVMWPLPPEERSRSRVSSDRAEIIRNLTNWVESESRGRKLNFSHVLPAVDAYLRVNFGPANSASRRGTK